MSGKEPNDYDQEQWERMTAYPDRHDEEDIEAWEEAQKPRLKPLFQQFNDIFGKGEK